PCPVSARDRPTPGTTGTDRSHTENPTEGSKSPGTSQTPTPTQSSPQTPTQSSPPDPDPELAPDPAPERPTVEFSGFSHAETQTTAEDPPAPANVSGATPSSEHTIGWTGK